MSDVIDMKTKRKLLRGTRRDARGFLEPTIDTDGVAGSRECLHVYIVISDPRVPTRRVKCRDCKEDLDPHAVLFQYAQRERSLYFATSARTIQLEETKREIEEAKRELASVKAKVRRVRKKEPSHE